MTNRLGSCVPMTPSRAGNSSSSDSISVAVRVRPSNSETDEDEWIVQNSIIYAAQPENQHNVFAFDQIFSQEKTNADVYEQVVSPIIDSVLDGYHGTVFAYGQTSSGKTHTMMGNDSDPGVIKRAIADIFERIHKATDREFMIRISYMEIYNEQIRDLLNPQSQSSTLQIKGPDMAVAGLTEQFCTDAATLLQWMVAGDKNRQMNLVDLAGSERATQTGATGTRLREGCHINTSLSALGLVIRKLSDGEKHINFRDSKLTRILQNSLGGNSRTAIICTIAPSDYETSLSTLRFGAAAKRIRNKPIINQVLTEDASLLQKRNKEIETLKELIHKVEAGKEQQLKEKDQTINELQKKIEDLQKLAITGELPPTITERRTSVPIRNDFRRRETWCPGQLTSATPAKALCPGTSARSDQANVGFPNDSFTATYGVYNDDWPSRPRKRKSGCALWTSRESSDSFDLSPNCPSVEADSVERWKKLYMDAKEEIRALKEDLSFIYNEQKNCCLVPQESAPKRSRLDSSEDQAGIDCVNTPKSVKPSATADSQEDPVTPFLSTKGLSLIQEENSGLDEGSPFQRKLELMATPRADICNLKRENLRLKLTLKAIGDSSVASETATTIRNLSLPSLVAVPMMADVACQCEQTSNQNETSVKLEAEPQAEDQKLEQSAPSLVDRATSPMISFSPEVSQTPVRSTPLRKISAMESLTNFSTPRSGKEKKARITMMSGMSWLSQEATPSLLPIECRDTGVQTQEPEETVIEKQTADVSVMTELVVQPLEVTSIELTAGHSERGSSTCAGTQAGPDLKDCNTSAIDLADSVLKVSVCTMTDIEPLTADANTSSIDFSDEAMPSVGSELVTVDGAVQTEEEAVPSEEIPKVETSTIGTATDDLSQMAEMFVQCSADCRDADTSTATLACSMAEAACQTDSVKADTSPSALSAGINALLEDESAKADSEQIGAEKATTRDIGVQARLEELWVIKMKLEKEQAARKDAEQRSEDLWREKLRLAATNDCYFSFLKKNGVDPKKVLSGKEDVKPLKEPEVAPKAAQSTPATPTPLDQYKKKYEAIKEFCWRHPDIKDRLLAERVVLARPKTQPITSAVAEKKSPEKSGKKPPGEQEASEGAEAAGGDRPLVELQGAYEFRGVDYMTKANPEECRTS